MLPSSPAAIKRSIKASSDSLFSEVSSMGFSCWEGGVSFGADGYWNIWGTFSPDILKKGIEATKEQVDLWFNKGVTEDELSAKKTTISGSYKVSMDSTAGLAAKILSNAEHGRELSYLDEYPKIIESISLSEVNSAIKKYGALLKWQKQGLLKQLRVLQPLNQTMSL